jgi:hypothetical protein
VSSKPFESVGSEKEYMHRGGFQKPPHSKLLILKLFIVQTILSSYHPKSTNIKHSPIFSRNLQQTSIFSSFPFSTKFLYFFFLFSSDMLFCILLLEIDSISSDYLTTQSLPLSNRSFPQGSKMGAGENDQSSEAKAKRSLNPISKYKKMTEDMKKEKKGLKSETVDTKEDVKCILTPKSMTISFTPTSQSPTHQEITNAQEHILHPQQLQAKTPATIHTTNNNNNNNNNNTSAGLNSNARVTNEDHHHHHNNNNNKDLEIVNSINNLRKLQQQSGQINPLTQFAPPKYDMFLYML